jgi:hypothetical protein
MSFMMTTNLVATEARDGVVGADGFTKTARDLAQ